jgi:PTH1 family peptidyl-tRNA hydrolase
VKSLVASIGSKEFYRLKVGVGQPPGRMDPADFVLRRFTPTERSEVDFLVQDAADVAETFLVDPEAAIEQASRRGVE